MNLQEIAKKLNVSSSTVSRALSPQKRYMISPQVREKVEKMAKKLNYVPNRAARDLATGKTNSIGVLLPTMFNSLFFNEQLARTLGGIYHVLGQDKEFNCKLVILPSEGSFEELDEQALSAGVDGLLISTQFDHFSKKAPYSPATSLSLWKKPIVFINFFSRQVRNRNLVGYDNFEASRQAATYLIKNGHRRIGLIYCEDSTEDSKQRYAGFIEGLKMHRVSVNKLFFEKGEYTRASGYDAALRICNKKGPKPTALFSINDEMAMGAIEAINSIGLSCPRDMAVMGFDGLEAGDYVHPRLTTVVQPSREIAEAGTQLLLSLIRKEARAPVIQTVPTRILVRDSV